LVNSTLFLPWVSLCGNENRPYLSTLVVVIFLLEDVGSLIYPENPNPFI
jgi:hypothetical protein